MSGEAARPELLDRRSRQALGRRARLRKALSVLRVDPGGGAGARRTARRRSRSRRRTISEGARSASRPTPARRTAIRCRRTRWARSSAFQYCAALALTGDPADPGDVCAPKRSRMPARRALAQRVEIVVDPEMEAAYPRHYGARVVLELANGERKTAARLDPHGMPADPCTDSELLEKFERLASRVKSRAAIAEIVRAARSAERLAQRERADGAADAHERSQTRHPGEGRGPGAVVLDSGLRRNDESISRRRPGSRHEGVLDSSLRRNDES